jgi:hypothetical protein
LQSSVNSRLKTGTWGFSTWRHSSFYVMRNIYRELVMWRYECFFTCIVWVYTYCRYSQRCSFFFIFNKNVV